MANLTKRYGNIAAVEKINLQIKDQEYICIIGPSGCGKTTLIKCIAGITEPTSGEIYVDSKLINAFPIQDREIGYVFQEIALFPHMNIYANVSYGPMVKGWEAAKTRSLVMEMLNMMALQDRIKDPPHILSGGARQKTAIARALSSGSHLLIFDEPLGSLDAKVRAVLRHELKRMVKELQLTAIHVTHDQEEAMAIADRIVVMKTGRIVEVGTPLELYLRPKQLFTANFVGESNFMIGETTKTEGDVVRVKVAGKFLNTTCKFEAKEQKVVAAVRPEFISIRELAKTTSTWKGEIENKIYVGSTVRYEIRAENGEVIVVKQPFTYETLKWKTGNRVNLAFSPSSILLYPYPEEGLEKAISIE